MPQLDSIERMLIYSDEDAALEELTYGENTTSTIDRNSTLALIVQLYLSKTLRN